MQRKQEIGDRIRALRLRKKVGQKQLAGIVGMTAANLCRIEKGQQSPSADQVEAIAAALGYASTARFYGARL